MAWQLWYSSSCIIVKLAAHSKNNQGHSQHFLIVGLKFSSPCSTQPDTNSSTSWENNWPPYVMSAIWYNIYDYSQKVKSLITCASWPTECYRYIAIAGCCYCSFNSCNYSYSYAKLHACAWLANTVAKYIRYILHQACRGIFLADHLHVHVRTCLPLVKASFKSMVCCSENFTVPAWLFTTYTVPMLPSVVHSKIEDN